MDRSGNGRYVVAAHGDVHPPAFHSDPERYWIGAFVYRRTRHVANEDGSFSGGRRSSYRRAKPSCDSAHDAALGKLKAVGPYDDAEPLTVYRPRSLKQRLTKTNPKRT